MLIPREQKRLVWALAAFIRALPRIPHCCFASASKLKQRQSPEPRVTQETRISLLLFWKLSSMNSPCFLSQSWLVSKQVACTNQLFPKSGSRSRKKEVCSSHIHWAALLQKQQLFCYPSPWLLFKRHVCVCVHTCPVRLQKGNEGCKWFPCVKPQM